MPDNDYYALLIAILMPPHGSNSETLYRAMIKSSVGVISGADSFSANAALDQFYANYKGKTFIARGDDPEEHRLARNQAIAYLSGLAIKHQCETKGCDIQSGTQIILDLRQSVVGAPSSAPSPALLSETVKLLTAPVD